jgi:hypothetical protein
MTTDTDTLESILFDRKKRIETLLNVANKSSEVVPMELNHIQDMMLATQSDMGRDLYLKPAQIGSTTLWVADFLLDCMLNVNRTAVILADNEKRAERLLLKAKSLYSNIVTSININGQIAPFYPIPLGRDSANEMFFPDLGSTLYIGSANSNAFGRGEPIHRLLCSEVAFYKNANGTISPAQDRVPMQGGMIVLESTPNGEEGDGAYFCQTYRAAKEGNSIYSQHFYRWFDFEEYQLPYGSIYALPLDRGYLDFTEEEAELIEKYDLTEDQIRWRRRKMLEKRQAYETGEDRLLFQQEFPEDDDNCFIVAGDQVYSPVEVERLSRKCYIPDKTYSGALVWFEPEEGHKYDIICDPSLGTGKAGNSKTVIQVWEFPIDEFGNETPKHCATASGYFTAEVAAGKLLDLADHYNKARICVETNPPGIPIAYMIQHYPFLYIREDIINGRMTNQIGWLTTPRTKPTMIAEMVRMLPKIETYDINFVSQLRNIRYINDRAIAVGPDDHHDTGAIAMVCRRTRRTTESGFVGTTRSWPNKR